MQVICLQHLRPLNDSKLMTRRVTQTTQLESIWNHSEPSEVTYVERNNWEITFFFDMKQTPGSSNPKLSASMKSHHQWSTTPCHCLTSVPGNHNGLRYFLSDKFYLLFRFTFILFPIYLKVRKSQKQFFLALILPQSKHIF